MDELQAWYTSLSKEERKMFAALKNDRKNELLTKTQDNDPIVNAIGTINAENYKEKIMEVEDLIDKYKGDKTQYGKLLTNAVIPFDPDYSFAGLPF
jgi:hypothetical protein